MGGVQQHLDSMVVVGNQSTPVAWKRTGWLATKPQPVCGAPVQPDTACVPLGALHVAAGVPLAPVVQLSAAVQSAAVVSDVQVVKLSV